MRRVTLFLMVIAFLTLGFWSFAQDAATQAKDPNIQYFRWIAAAIAVGLSSLAGGIAVGQVGAAAMAAMSENPDLAGKAVIYVGLAEGICLWGFLIAILVLFL